jgi:hypothetical protein
MTDTVKYRADTPLGTGPKKVEDLEHPPYNMSGDDISKFIAWLYDHPRWKWATRPGETEPEGEVHANNYFGGTLYNERWTAQIKDFDLVIFLFRKHQTRVTG